MADDIRSFIAVPVPPALRDQIARVIARLRAQPGGDRVRWVRGENLHVTLRFLGNIEARLVPDLLERLGEQVAELERFELSLTRVSLFPNPRRPSVVALELAPVEPLTALAAAVESAAAAAGLPPEERPFRAHLTLGRIRERRSLLDVTASDTALTDPLPVNEVVLFQSELRRSGALHTPLGKALLA